MDQITTEDELRELLGFPAPRTATKQRPCLDPIDKAWLAASPFCLVATSGTDGSCDVSPKGDPAGALAHVLDDTTIALAERPGNKRADGYLNMLANPHVGLLFVIPGRNDTLRINGRARLVRDAPFFDDMLVKGHRPVLAVVIDIDEVFYHCAKAFLRSDLWAPETWHPEVVPSRAHIAQKLERPDESIEDLQRYYGPDYLKGLYTAPR
jgi:PPOX class probable FMN-dependent enzyme